MGKKVVLIIGAVLALVMGAAFVSLPAHAAGVFGSADMNYVKSGDTVDGSAYYTGKSVQIDGTVNGDVYCATSNLVIDGTVNGDVYCAGSSLTVAGTVNGDVRVAGSSLTLRGTVTGSATALGSNITVESAGNVGRDATFAGSNVLVNGTVGRDVVIAADTATVNGKIGRDVEGSVTSLHVPSDAVIGGFLHYTSDTDATVSGTVKGGVVRTPAAATHTGWQAGFFGGLVLFAVMAVLWTLVSALALQLVLPKKMAAVTTIGGQSAIVAGALGLLSLFLVPLVAVLFMTSVIGLPLGIALLTGWVTLCIMSTGVTAIYLGRALWGGRNVHPLAATAFAALGLGVTFVIPFINVLTIIGSLALGVGAVLYAVRSEYGNGPTAGPRVKLAAKGR